MTIQATHAFADDVDRLSAQYSELLKRFGDGPESAQYSDRDTQERRYHQLSRFGDLRDCSILDFGCATAHLLTVLKRDYGYRGQYTGYDISPEMVAAAARKHPDAHFECRDVLDHGVAGQFDVVMISGTFNNILHGGPQANWAWMRATLPVLFASATQGMAFNNLSRYVDYFDDGLFYTDPMEVFGFCKEQLSPLVTLQHDYCMKALTVPYEFTTFVHKTSITNRPLNTV